MGKCKVILISIILGIYLTACSVKAAATNNQFTGIEYAGVNVEKFCWENSNGCEQSMRLWETFTPGRYIGSKMESLLTAVSKDFNTVRITIGSAHLVDSDIGPSYQANLIDTLKMAKAKGVWVIIGVWPAAVNPKDNYYDDLPGAGSDVFQYQFDPYFYDRNEVCPPTAHGIANRFCRANNFELIQRPAMRALAQIIKANGLTDTVLYVDLRNEIDGHMGSYMDPEWFNASEKYYGGDSQWGYVPDRAAPSFQTWLIRKYPNISALNSAWRTSYTAFQDILVPHINTNEIATADVQEWLIWCLRDWVTTLRNDIQTINPGLRVGQSTADDTTDNTSNSVSVGKLYRQEEIGDIVDVLDTHLYKVSTAKTVVRALKLKWPEKPFISGETYLDNNEVEGVYSGGGQGIISWSSGCSARSSHCIHEWVNWTLTPFGKSFVSALAPYKKYIYPTIVSPTPIHSTGSNLFLP